MDVYRFTLGLELVCNKSRTFLLVRNPVACSKIALQIQIKLQQVLWPGNLVQVAVLFSTKMQMYTQSLTIFCHNERTHQRIFQFVSFN